MEITTITATVYPKSLLKHGEYYSGQCRNASVARWDADKQVFYHWRTKFGSTYIETINHPEDDDGFDVFYPLNHIDLEGIPIPLEEEKEDG